MDRVEQYKAVQRKLLSYSEKNKDYGDAFANYGLLGLL